MRHIDAIALSPHPSGSAANAKVREYIGGRLLELGLQIQRQTFSFEGRKSHREVEGVNLIARMPGRNLLAQPRGALALACHYDSVAGGPGACDDGMGVATLLETARALKNGQPLKNDIFFVFTDGEEEGLQGAQALAKRPELLEPIGLVLNFEARGVSGPVYMFETSAGNARLIRDFRAAAPRPVANSLMYEVYKHMPNDTDLTVFKKAGLTGLNFGLIGDPQHYHTATDDPAHVHRQTLQHEGSYALNLARHFGDGGLADLHGMTDAVYFDLFGFALICYDASWAMPLAIAALAAYLAAIIRVQKRGMLKLRGLFLAVLFWAVLVAMVGVFFRAIAPRNNNAGSTFWFVCVAITLGLCVGAQWIAGRRFRFAALVFGGLFWWTILGLVTARWLPGGSYLFFWPALFQIGSCCGWIFLKNSFARATVLALGALPTILLITPLVRQFYVAIGSAAVLAPMVVLALECGALALPIEALIGRRSCVTTKRAFEL